MELKVALCSFEFDGNESGSYRILISVNCSTIVHQCSERLMIRLSIEALTAFQKNDDANKGQIF